MDKRQYNREEVVKHIEPFNAYYRTYPISQMIMSGQRFKNSSEYLKHIKNKRKQVIHKIYYSLFCRHIYELAEIPSKGNLLSLGCGFGGDEKNLACLYPNLETWGIDLSQAMVEVAVRNNEEHSHVRHCLAMAEFLPFPDEYFDRIISREVIEHVIDPLVMMKEVKRVLSPGGICVITTPNAGSLAKEHLKERILKFLSLSGEHAIKDDHIAVDRALQVFKDAGLEVKEVFYDGVLYFHLTSKTPNIFLPLLGYFEKILRPLQFLPILKQLLCDQVKYVLIEPGKKAAIAERENIDLVCPRCKNKLNKKEVGGDWVCSICAERYLYRDGYHDFLYTSTMLKDNKAREKNESAGKHKEKQRLVLVKKMMSLGGLVYITAEWFLWTLFYLLLMVLLLPISLVLKVLEK